MVEGVKLRRRIAGRKAASGDFNGGRETLAWSERSIGQKELEVAAAVGVASGLVGESSLASSRAADRQRGREWPSFEPVIRGKPNPESIWGAKKGPGGAEGAV